jgi:hypothetical protein
MPSGREYHSTKPYIPPALEEDVIIRMRGPPDSRDTVFEGEEDPDSTDEEESLREPVVSPVPLGIGAFPGSQGEQSRGESYY